jgi:hypothetical protein
MLLSLGRRAGMSRTFWQCPQLLFLDRGLSQSAARGQSDPLGTIPRAKLWRSRCELGQLALRPNEDTTEHFSLAAAWRDGGMSDRMQAGHQGLVEWLKPPEPPGWLAMAVAFDVGTRRCRRQSRPPAKRQGAGAVQDAVRGSCITGQRLASWTAAALRRFCWRHFKAMIHSSG